MNELSLFSGVGGGLLGTKHLLGWRTIGYVEINDYCQRVIAQRIKDGLLDKAPTFGDIRTFLSEGYAENYQGMVDVITGGFPCQPFSVAGKGKAEEDERNMWPQTIDVIRRVKPRFIFLENVPGLTGHDYFITIMREIAEAGYQALPPLVLGASDVGANHRRKRLWIVAHSTEPGLEKRINNGRKKGPHAKFNRTGYATCLANTPCQRFKNNKRSKEVTERYRGGTFGCSSWWNIEPQLGRVVDGMADRVDRLKAIGNGQVPAVVKTVWELLWF